MKRNSVTVGEIGLRYFGAIALAFPVSRWKAAARTMGAEGLKAGIKEGFNPDSFSGYTGAAYLAGKSIALFSKVPDPYDNTHKHSTIDTIREKYLFKLSSATEAVAAGLLAYNGLTQKKILSKGKLVRDWPGGIGGMLFMSGLVIRMFAPFGTKELNMRELNAHITDSIAQVPIDKIPQATADTAAFLTEHFKDKKFRNQNVEFGKTYTELAADLYRYHNIALPGADGGVGNNVVNVDAAAPANDKVAAFARPEMKKPDLAAMPRPASFQDRTAATPEAAMQRV